MTKLLELMRRKQSVVSVGIDPVLEKFPQEILDSSMSLSEKLFEFSKTIVDAVEPYAVAIKPQIAFFEQYGLEGMKAYAALAALLRERDVFFLADVKRGDIGSTARAYASAYLESGADFECDAVTINPYLGDDNNMEFFRMAKIHGKAVFVLVKTSNPSSSQFQDKCMDELTLYERVANSLLEADCRSEQYIGAVVGATWPIQLEELRARMPRTIFLIPGYGTQGGRAEDIRHAFGQDGFGAIVNASRSIDYAFQKGGSLGEAAAEEARRMRDALNRQRIVV